MADSTDDLPQAIQAAPLGVALLARLEAWASGESLYARPAPTSTARVNKSVALVDRIGWGEFVDAVVYVATIDVGPWIPDAPHNAADAYRDAETRTPIAQAIAARFGDRLQRPCIGAEQQWWTTNNGTWDHKLAPLFQDFERVYDAGQFTWAGLWTVSDPPCFAHAQLVDSWEMVPTPVTRWALPTRPDANVFEIHRPRDWVQLVQEHPRQAAANGECWELPSRNQDVDGIKALLTVPGQHAARGQIRTHFVPDWRSVAQQYDGVHLSWAGFITAEGFVSDLGDSDVAMLRFWFSERTHWLDDVFGEPVPLGVSHFAPKNDNNPVESVLEPDPETRSLLDRAVLEALLNRRKT